MELKESKPFNTNEPDRDFALHKLDGICHNDLIKKACAIIMHKHPYCKDVVEHLESMGYLVKFISHFEPQRGCRIGAVCLYDKDTKVRLGTAAFRLFS